MIITGLCAANGAKRVDYYNSLPTPEKIHFKSQIGLVIHNRAVICAALLLGAVTLVNTMSSALSLYYLRCVVENMGLKAVFSLVSLGISLVVIPMMPAMLRKFGKIKTVFIGMFVILLQSIWLLVRREFATDLEVIDMIVNLKIAYPIVLMIVTVILVKLYPITPAFAKTMRAELKERREAAKKNS